MKRQKRGVKAARLLIILAICTAIALFCAAALFNRYYPLRYLDIINECAEEYGFEPAFICAVIHTESKFNSEAVSGKGASGLMQITENTAYWLAGKMDLENFDYGDILDPRLNIQLGCYYLRLLEKQYGGLEMALCAYNAGSGTVDRWLSDTEHSDDGETLKNIPFQETRVFIKRISDSQKIYAFRLRFTKEAQKR